MKKNFLEKLLNRLHVFQTTPDEVEKYVTMIQLSSSDNCVYRYNVEILNLSDQELPQVNTKPMIKNN